MIDARCSIVDNEVWTPIVCPNPRRLIRLTPTETRGAKPVVPAGLSSVVTPPPILASLGSHAKIK